MPDQKQEARTLLLMAVLALWLTVYGYSIVVLMTTASVADGSGRGLSRITVFLGWQGVAGILAFGCWGIGWSFPKGSGVRRVSGVPLGLALTLILVGAGMLVFT